MIKFDTPVLESPTLNFGNRTINVKDGRWNNQGNKFYKPMSISKWIVYVFDDKLDYGVVNGFAQELIRIGKEHGLQINQPYEIVKPDYDDYKRNPFNYFEKEIKEINPDFILAVLPDHSPVYGKENNIFFRRK